MKKLSTILMMVIAMAMATPNSFAQSKDQKKAEKAIKKEVKNYKDEGWQVAPGNLSMELQLKESYAKALEKDENGYDKFIQGEAMSIAETYDAGLFQATELAKLNLAGKIQTEVTQLIDNKLANKQLSDKQAASLAESAAASKNLVSQKIGRVITPVKMYRELNNGNVEVRIIIYYSHEMAMDAMKSSIREDLESKADDLAKQLDSILGL